jgi:DNA/RNA-binding domain of Phe-tRNA-synthetase-like protein
MTFSSGDEPRRGWCERDVELELPGLGVVSLTAPVQAGGALLAGSPPAVLARLRELSNRWRGAQAIGVRSQPVPAAYRVFFRHIGLDPDVTRTPLEEIVLERMVDGGFISKGTLCDALTIVLLDTGVPVWALDADTLRGPLGVRVSRDAERLGGEAGAPAMQAGRLVLADAEHPVASMFGEIAPRHRPGRRTRELELFAVQVAGVPLLHVEEALWNARALLTGG